jgi:repressor of nif and glnA expression
MIDWDNKDDKSLQEAYNEIYNKTMEMIIEKKYEPQMIAGTLMAQALKMYKATLTDQDYIKMVEAMRESALTLSPMIDKTKLN